MPRYRQVVAGAHRGRGREVISLDWTYVHYERGLQIWGVKKAWAHVTHRLAPYQTVVTAVVANRARLDGIEVVVQQPDRHAEKMAYLQETVQASYTQMEAARGRLLALLHHLLHRRGYKPTVSLLMIPLVYCHIKRFQRASRVEKPWPGGEKRRDGRASHPEAL
jgi:hypothetical protein